MSSIGSQIQQQIVDEINVLPILADNNIVALADSPASVKSVMDIALAKVAFGVIVRTAKYSKPNSNAPRGKPYFNFVAFQIEINENRVLNAALGRTIHADDVVEAILADLSGWDFDGQGNTLKLDDDAGVLDAVWNNPEGQVVWGWTVSGHTEGGLSLVHAQVAKPTSSIAGTTTTKTVTLACATGGAGVFYTADGSIPTPLRGTVYTGPFVAPVGTVIRARAWLAGMIPSSELKVTVQ